MLFFPGVLSQWKLKRGLVRPSHLALLGGRGWGSPFNLFPWEKKPYIETSLGGGGAGIAISLTNADFHQRCPSFMLKFPPPPESPKRHLNQQTGVPRYFDVGVPEPLDMEL